MGTIRDWEIHFGNKQEIESELGEMTLLSGVVRPGFSYHFSYFFKQNNALCQLSPSPKA
jgi:predicted cupin superfamily sugar epimerase